MVDVPPEGRVDFVSPVTPPVSARMSPCSPPEVSLVQSADSSVAISPNRVRSDNSPDILDAEPVFEVSLDTSGFLMRLLGAAVQAPVSCLPLQPGSQSDCDPVLGESVAFTLSGPLPPMTFPVYPLPSGLAVLPVPPSAQTVLASAVSSRPDSWFSSVPRAYDVSREGPFDAYCSPMDTGDSPLVAMGLTSCPYRITSIPAQILIPRFLEFMGAPESARLLYRSPTFWIQRIGEEDDVAAVINLQRDARVML